MIKVSVSGNACPVVEIFAPETTLRQILEQCGIPYNGRQIFLNGGLTTSLDSTLAEFGVKDYCTLTAAEQKNNA